MNPFGRFQLLGLVLVCAVACNVNQLLRAQEENQFSDFAQHMPKANTEVFAINNLAGHTMFILENKALRRAMADGGFGVLGVAELDAAKDFVEGSREYFPDTVAISGNKDVYGFTINVFELLLRLNMLDQAVYADEDFSEDVSKLESELAEILKSSKIPDITVWMKWPEGELSAGIFEGFKQQVAVAGLLTELEFVSGDDSFQLTGTVADCVERDVVVQYLNFMGVEEAEELADAALDLEIFVDAEFEDGAMRVSIGTDASGEPRSTLEDMEGLQNGPTEIAFGKWNGTHAHEAIERLKTSMADWSETELGQLFIANDTQDVWNTFQGMVDQLEMISDNGQMRVWRDSNQIRANIREVGVPSAESLVGSAIVDWVPADIESYAISNQRTFGDYLVGWMTYFEEQLAQRSLKEQIGGDLEQALSIEYVLEVYHLNFNSMRTALRDELAPIPALPFAIVMDTDGELETLNLDVDSETFEPMTLEVDRFIRLAAISKTDDTEKLLNKMMQVYEEFVRATLSACETGTPDELVLFKDVDLGDGLRAKELSFEWLMDAEIADVEIEGDLQPHLFVRGDYVVFSTSIDFTKKLLNSEKSLELGDVGSEESLVNCGRFRGLTFGNLYRTIFSILGQVLEQNSDGRDRTGVQSLV